MSHTHVVVVDDEASVRETLRDFLQDEGYQVTAVSEGQAAVQAVRDEPTQIVLTDMRLPGMDGLEIMEQVQQVNAQIACIVMTGYGTIEHAVKAMKAGAFDFITKPVQLEAVSVVIRKALEFQQLRQENLLLRKAVKERYRLQHMVGASEPMRALHEFIEKVADSDSTILIHGESGTGKELVARMLHFNSLRRDRPLVPVNCGAIPENLLESELFGHEKGSFTGALSTRIGRFELAHGGTLFLDEVGEMSPSLQVKLLRALQERAFERVGGTKTVRVDVRIIAATNQDLEQMIEGKTFRKDLYYRLNVIPVVMPPLRDRQSDIPLLVDHFLQQFNESKGTTVTTVDRDALAALSQYHWPGNIRELQNLIERLLIIKKSGSITLADLPEKIQQAKSGAIQERPAAAALPGTMDFNGAGVDLMKELEQYENRLILEALRQTNGVTSKAAQLLHLNRTTLVEKIKRKGWDAKVSGAIQERPAGAALPEAMDFTGAGVVLVKIHRQIQELAKVDTTVLIEGETGTGKEVVARAIHHYSARRSQPFIAVNCAGLTDSLLGSQLFGHRKGAFTEAVDHHRGLFEAADGGTIFLDEIGGIPQAVQAALLRVLQEREILRVGEFSPRKINVRILAATHHDLSRDVLDGTFRADLLYRIRVARIQLPPLRERRSDIPLLASAFRDECSRAVGKPVEDISAEAMNALISHSWPGNLRELRGVIESAVVSCEGAVIQLDDLPSEIRSGLSFAGAEATEDEKARILSALQRAKGNRTEAAKLLGMSRATFYRRLTDLSLLPDRSI